MDDQDSSRETKQQGIGSAIRSAISQSGNSAINYVITVINNYSHPFIELAFGYKPTLQERIDLLNRLQLSYKRFYNHLLAQTIYISPRFHQRIGTGDHLREDILALGGKEEEELPPDTSIMDIYNNFDRVLILGASGTGKTTLLYKQAIHLLDKAQDNPSERIPVVVKLPSWTMKQRSIQEWLINEIINQGGGSIKYRFASYLVKNDKIIPMLDGLDEVAEGVRADCIKAINAYQSNHPGPLLVCSRTQQYQTLVTEGTYLNLPNTVIIQPLQPERVIAELKQASQPTTAVRYVLRNNPFLRELVSTPLMVSMAVQIYHDKTVKAVRQMESIEHEQQLFKLCVEKRLGRRLVRGQFSTKDAVGWLVWLAQQMQQRHAAEFYLEHLSPDWLAEKWMRYVYQLCSVLVGLIIGAIFGLVSALFFGLFIGLTMGLTMGLSLGLFFGLQEPQPAETPKISCRSTCISIAFGLILGLLLGQVIIRPIAGSFFGIVFGLVSGPVFSLIFGVLFGLSDIVPTAMMEGSLRSKAYRKPNQEIWRSRGNALQIGSFFTLICGITLVLAFGPVFGSLFGVTFGLIFGLGYGGLAYVQHYILRFLLQRQGVLPWQYEYFLEEARERSLLERVGGGYQFFPTPLREYFASLSSSDILEIVTAVTSVTEGEKY